MVNLHIPKVFGLLNLKKNTKKLHFHYLIQDGRFGILKIKYFLFVRSGKLTFSKGFWTAEHEKNVMKLHFYCISQDS